MPIDDESTNDKSTGQNQVGCEPIDDESIRSMLEERRVVLEWALEPVVAACRQGEIPAPADLLIAREQLADFRAAFEEYVARTQPELATWDDA